MSDVRLNPRAAGRLGVLAMLVLPVLGLPGLVGCKSGGPWRDRGSSEEPREAEPVVGIEAAEAISRAEMLRTDGQLEAALIEFERAIEVNPRLTVAYLGAGDIYRQQGNYPEAEKRYATAAEVEPRNFDAQYYHGLTLQLMNRVSEAVRAYLRALSIRPEDFEANLNLATAYLQLQEAGQALPYAQRAVRLNPSSGPARVNLGSVYAALGRHAEAVTEYLQAAEQMDLSSELLLNLADSYGKIERYQEMLATLEQLVARSPSAIGYERLGFAKFRVKSYDEALRAFQQALALDSNHYPALNGVGVCMLNRYLWSERSDRGALDEAMRVLKRSLQLQPDQPRIVELVTRYG
jgi:tetratricopeptide (TPR) repeat protein